MGVVVAKVVNTGIVKMGVIEVGFVGTRVVMADVVRADVNGVLIMVGLGVSLQPWEIWAVRNVPVHGGCALLSQPE